MSREWQALRKSINHDWLPDFLLSTDPFLKRLGDPSPSLSYLREFLTIDLPVWGQQRSDILDLIGRAEEELSPRTLFTSPLLSECPEDIRVWFEPLIHGLWLAKYGIRARVAFCKDAFEIANKTYEILIAKRNAAGESDAMWVVEARDMFEQFATAIRALRESISGFPTKIEAI
jgi:hypothetical protein